jgi:hypothetical protein
VPMAIELRDLKVTVSPPTPTLCFTASLYLDGEPVGTVSNPGDGGQHDFSSDVAESRLWHYAKGSPDQPTVDSLIDDVLAKQYIPSTGDIPMVTIPEPSLIAHPSIYGTRARVLRRSHENGEFNSTITVWPDGPKAACVVIQAPTGVVVYASTVYQTVEEYVQRCVDAGDVDVTPGGTA